MNFLNALSDVANGVNMFISQRKKPQQWGQQGQGMGVFNKQNRHRRGNDLHGHQWIQQQNKQQQFNVLDANQIGNIVKNIQQQITQVQQSPQQQTIQNLKRNGGVFIDNSFPANQNSLIGQYQMQSSWTSIKWRKATEIMKNPQIFINKPEPNDIKQGALGDCYFLAGLAALAQRPDRIATLFLQTELNAQKYFKLNILFKGKWLTVIMDQYIPCSGNTPAFTKSVDNQLWVVLLQKAWAKVYTSYKRIEAGYAQQAIHDLTGAPIKQITFYTSNFDKQSQWQYLLQASAKQYSMVCSSQPGSDTQQSTKGVVQGHAYTFLNAIQLHVNGSIQRLVQLRNPWGKGQWSGMWSDNDPNWNYVSPQQKQNIGFDKDSNDGVFFMPYDQFIKQFRSLTVAQIDDNASYLYASHYDTQLKGAYFTITIEQPGQYSFHVQKTPQRIYPDQYQAQYMYPESTFQIAKVNGNSVQKYQGIRSSRRTLFKKQKLQPGTYIAYAKTNYDRNWQSQFQVVLAVYAPYVCQIRASTRQQAAIYTGNPNIDWVPKSPQGQGMQQQQQQQYQVDPNLRGLGGNSGNNGWGNQQQPQQQGGWGGQQQPQQGGWGGQQQQGGWGGQQQPQQGGWGGQQQGGWGGQQQQGGWGGQQQGGWGGQQRGGW